jgi:tetratricopeptide (TPR) repeat protein
MARTQSSAKQSRSRRPVPPRSKASAMKGELTTLLSGTFRKAATLSFWALVISAALTFKQWLDAPIAIRPFTVIEDASTAGISATTLADQTKAHISAIYAASGNLFQTRKLGEPTMPLDIKIGDTGWTFQSLTNALVSAFGTSLTSADISGRIVKDGAGLSLQWTTVRAGSIKTDKFPISDADTPPLVKVDAALACLALRIVAELSPDVAANYLQKQDEADGSNKDCLAPDVVELYSRVSKNESLPAAARVNALVGLSVYYSHVHQLFNELNMAEAATNLASRALSCDDRNALPLRSQRLKCRLSAFRPFSHRNLRAEIAAWMQLGVARSDYASVAPTLLEMNDRRSRAIEAYNHVIAIKDNYPDAYDAKGLQLSLLNEPSAAAEEYRHSLAVRETSPARIDLAALRIHGSNDSFSKRNIPADELADAESHFRSAIELSPDYWHAYGGLGYVLYKAGKLGDAADAVKVAVQHDESNRSLRLLLSTVYAGLCQFDAAKASFEKAYADAYAHNQDNDNALNIMSDWGKVLGEFGLAAAAIAQESAVLAYKPNDVDALRARGEIEMKTAGTDPDAIAAGLKDLRAAVDHDPAKSDVVLSAYLEGLLQAHRADEAVFAYQTWSRNGFVPPLATTPISDAVILPAKPNARLAYAKALLQIQQRGGASREFAVLSQLGMGPAAQVRAELQAQAESSEVTDAIVMPVSTRTHDTAQPEARAHGKHECHIPALTRQELLPTCVVCGSTSS